jgi:HEAT repeat protein
LHALATFVAAHDDQPRREIAQALASTLSGNRAKEAKGFVIRQLQVCGGKEVVEALGNQLHDEELCADAAAALLSIGTTGDAFRKALTLAKGKQHRLTLIQALSELRDSEAADLLRVAARDEDSGVRQASLWGLANIADPDDAERLIAATGAGGYERIQATRSCLLLAERLLAAGRQTSAEKIYRHLRDTPVASESYIREAAERGLATVQERQRAR